MFNADCAKTKERERERDRRRGVWFVVNYFNLTPKKSRLVTEKQISIYRGKTKTNIKDFHAFRIFALKNYEVFDSFLLFISRYLLNYVLMQMIFVCVLCMCPLEKVIIDKTSFSWRDGKRLASNSEVKNTFIDTLQ
jgi:hypothetical protein